MPANTNVPRQTRKETRALSDFCFTNEVGLGASTINGEFALFYCDRDFAIDSLKYAYSTAGAADDEISFAYASDLAGTSLTTILDNQPIDGAAGDYNAVFGDHAPIVPAGNWLFINHADSGTVSTVAGLRVFIQGRMGVRA